MSREDAVRRAEEWGYTCAIEGTKNYEDNPYKQVNFNAVLREAWDRGFRRGVDDLIGRQQAEIDAR